ncbi:MAG: type II secretion system F family protein [Fimbriimonadaceae bacterium]|nr:type II secretion system F family protein [Fimbriimonadaceae bacterium]
MPVFEYQAIDKEGKAIRGTLFSGSVSQASEQLLSRGLTVQHLGVPAGYDDPLGGQPTGSEGYVPYENAGPTQAPPQEGSAYTNAPPTEPRSNVQTNIVGPLFNTVPLTQLQMFFRQLATMLKAGVGLAAALDTLAGQTVDPRLVHVIREMKGHAEAGRPMSAGMQRYPEIFSPMMVSLIRVGEEMGGLEEQCARTSEYIEREVELRNLLKRVTLYPKIVVVVSILVIGAANTIIKMAGKEGGISSPLTTLSTWFVIGPLLIGAWLFVKFGLRNPATKQSWDAMLLRIPALGPTLHGLCMAKFGRAFGAMYSSGVPLPKAVKLGADSCGNEHIRARIYPVANQLQEGAGITETFVKTGVFSPIVLDMARTGEQTGNIDFMLNKMAEFYEEEGRTKSMQFGVIFGVVCLICVAIYVGIVVIKFYIEMYSGAANAMS